MEKTIIIDGRPVTFKATGGLQYRYKSQFGRELFQDMILIEKSMLGIKAPPKSGGKTTLQAYELTTAYAITGASLEMMYNVLWCMAKTADNTIPDPQTWLDSFENFKVWDIWAQVEDIINANMEIDPKNA